MFVIHQLNIGGAQKAAISALNAIDYSQNDVTVYVRKKRLDLLPRINSHLSRIIINEDNTRYYLKPYALWLQLWQWVYRLLGKDETPIWHRIRNFIATSQMEYEKKHYFSDGVQYDVAISYLQGFHAMFVAKYIDARRKVMFYHGSTDSLHDIHEAIMGDFSGIYCVTPGAMKELQGFYPQFASRMRYLENVVPYKEIREMAVESAISRKDGCLVLCSCGRLSHEKGFDIAVDAASHLKEMDVDFIWYFVGDGPEKENLKAKVQSLELDKHIVFTGMQLNPYPYIRVCDIYVQPSREEAQGLTIIEAQILLRPVVSTCTIGGMALIDDGRTGALADINGPALAEAIERLAKDESARKGISDALRGIDYAAKERDFRDKWTRLLEV